MAVRGRWSSRGVRRRDGPSARSFEFFALVVAGDEGDGDARIGDIAAVETEAGVGLGQAFGELGGVAGGLGAVNANAVLFPGGPV